MKGCHEAKASFLIYDSCTSLMPFHNIWCKSNHCCFNLLAELWHDLFTATLESSS